MVSDVDSSGVFLKSIRFMNKGTHTVSEAVESAKSPTCLKKAIQQNCDKTKNLGNKLQEDDVSQSKQCCVSSINLPLITQTNRSHKDDADQLRGFYLTSFKEDGVKMDDNTRKEVACHKGQLKRSKRDLCLKHLFQDSGLAPSDSEMSLTISTNHLVLSRNRSLSVDSGHVPTPSSSTQTSHLPHWIPLVTSKPPKIQNTAAKMKSYYSWNSFCTSGPAHREKNKSDNDSMCKTMSRKMLCDSSFPSNQQVSSQKTHPSLFHKLGRGMLPFWKNDRDKTQVHKPFLHNSTKDMRDTTFRRPLFRTLSSSPPQLKPGLAENGTRSKSVPEVFWQQEPDSKCVYPESSSYYWAWKTCQLERQRLEFGSMDGEMMNAPKKTCMKERMVSNPDDIIQEWEGYLNMVLPTLRVDERDKMSNARQGGASTSGAGFEHLHNILSVLHGIAEQIIECQSMASTRNLQQESVHKEPTLFEMDLDPEPTDACAEQLVSGGERVNDPGESTASPLMPSLCALWNPSDDPFPDGRAEQSLFACEPKSVHHGKTMSTLKLHSPWKDNKNMHLD
uniref:uncharacterized protein isoform X2 n=1 Tax=Myxine glutinosa TaxID=7769 RepID=UPI00358FCDEB